MFFFVSAQSEQELRDQLANATGKDRIELMNKIAFQNIFNDQPEALRLAKSMIQESESMQYEKGVIQGINIRGIVNDIRGNSDSARFYFNKGYVMSKEQGLKELEANGLNNLGMMHWNLGLFEQSLVYFYDALRLYDSLQLTSGISKAVSNIGLINQELLRFEEALKFNFRSLTIRLAAGNDDNIARSYNNIGICYKGLNQLDSALYYYGLGLKYAQKANATGVESSIVDNLANVYQIRKSFDKAIELHHLSLELNQNRSSLSALATNANLSALYNEVGNHQQALLHALTADSIIRGVGSFGTGVDTYRNMGEAYLQLGLLDSATKYYNYWGVMIDSIYSERSAEAVAKMAAEYETEKKEQQIEILSTKERLQQAEIEQTRFLVIAVLIIAILVILGILLVNSRKRYKLKAVMAEQKEELQRTRFKAVIDAEEKERKRIAKELHDGLGQLLSTARITVSSLEQNAKVENSLKVIDMAVKEVRSISHNMMPNALMNVGLKPALEDMIRKIDESGSVRAVFINEGETALPESISVTVYRVVQEVINNALKYAEATNITMKVTHSDLGMEIEVSDDGKGFDTAKIAQGEGIGWTNIYSRMELVGGQVTVHSELNKGTTVRMTLPQTSLDSKLAG
jgi:signal transduction histidine kinase